MLGNPTSPFSAAESRRCRHRRPIGAAHPPQMQSVIDIVFYFNIISKKFYSHFTVCVCDSSQIIVMEAIFRGFSEFRPNRIEVGAFREFFNL